MSLRAVRTIRTLPVRFERRHVGRVRRRRLPLAQQAGPGARVATPAEAKTEDAGVGGGRRRRERHPGSCTKSGPAQTCLPHSRDAKAAAVADAPPVLDAGERGRYPRSAAFFALHGLAAVALGVVAAVLIAGRHSAAAVGPFWLVGGAYLIAGGLIPRLRFGPVTWQRRRASYARVRRGVPRFGDRAAVAFDPYGRALTFIGGLASVVYGVLRLSGRG